MREKKPDAAFEGFTPVTDLANRIADLWDSPAEAVNGARLWMTEKP